MNRLRQLCWGALLAVCLFASGAQLADKPSADLEYKVKAVLLLKLISYVDWPTNTFENPSAPFRIVVLGPDPFGPLLDEVVKGEQPKGRSVEIVRAKTIMECARSQMVFITASEKNRFASLLPDLESPGILTVSDIDRFARKGGMIGMVRDDKNVRFEVNIDACKRAKLNVNPRLSAFARVVTPDK